MSPPLEQADDSDKNCHGQAVRERDDDDEETPLNLLGMSADEDAKDVRMRGTPLIPAAHVEPQKEARTSSAVERPARYTASAKEDSGAPSHGISAAKAKAAAEPEQVTFV